MSLTERLIRKIPLELRSKLLQYQPITTLCTTTISTPTARVSAEAIAHKHSHHYTKQTNHILVRSLSTAIADLPTPSPEPVNAKAATNRLLRQVKQFIEAEGNTAKAEELVLNTDLTKLEDPIRVFNRILLAYAESNERKKLEAFFWKFSKSPNMPNPDEVSFNVFLKAQPVKIARKWLDMMLKRGMAETLSCNTLISAYCKQGLPNEAIQMLDKLLQSSRELSKIQADVFSFSPIIRILGKRGLPQQAEKLFESMQAHGIEPDLISWSTVIHAWSDSKLPEAPSRVSKLLGEMEESNVTPDTAVYNTVLLTLANAGNRGAEAEEMLASMCATPNVISYTTCISAWKNSPDIPEALERAEGLLESMKSEGLIPNVITYSTLISIYARDGMAERAEMTLSQMTRPNVITYTAVLEAWSNSGREDAVTQAFALLNRMEVKPNVTTFNTVIKVIGVSRTERDKLRHLNVVRSMMQGAECKPNLRSFNAMLNVCAADSEKRALDYALNILEELRSTPQMISQIDNYTYPSLFKVLAAHGAPFETVEEIFSICCEDQAVTRMVLSHMKRCCSISDLKKLLPVYNVENFELRELPHTWRKRYERTHEKQRRRRG